MQRDILPIVEGSTVNTKYGPVKTDHMLFIAAGAFHVSKPSDLIPELQGRFPIRVELEPLSGEDLVRILARAQELAHPSVHRAAGHRGVQLHLHRRGRRGDRPHRPDPSTSAPQNIGARRLHTVLERLLDDVSFTASEQGPRALRLDVAYVRERLAAIVQDEDLSRYIL